MLVEKGHTLLKQKGAVLLKVGDSVLHGAAAKVVLSPSLAFVGETHQPRFDKPCEVVVECRWHLCQLVCEHLRIPCHGRLTNEEISKHAMNHASSTIIRRGLTAFSHQAQRVNQPFHKPVNVSVDRRKGALDQAEGEHGKLPLARAFEVYAINAV